MSWKPLDLGDGIQASSRADLDVEVERREKSTWRRASPRCARSRRTGPGARRRGDPQPERHAGTTVRASGSVRDPLTVLLARLAPRRGLPGVIVNVGTPFGDQLVRTAGVVERAMCVASSARALVTGQGSRRPGAAEHVALGDGPRLPYASMKSTSGFNLRGHEPRLLLGYPGAGASLNRRRDLDVFPPARWIRPGL